MAIHQSSLRRELIIGVSIFLSLFIIAGNIRLTVTHKIDDRAELSIKHNGKMEVEHSSQRYHFNINAQHDGYIR